MEIQFTLNKKQVTAEVGADTVLLGVLRDLGCKSVKCGCETTNCGLCTVWIDGKSRRLQIIRIVTKINLSHTAIGIERNAHSYLVSSVSRHRRQLHNEVEHTSHDELVALCVTPMVSRTRIAHMIIEHACS